jgi:hypothetical protein
MACLRAVQASKRLGLLGDGDGDGGPHMPFAEHREIAEAEKRERWRPHKPVDLKCVFAKREGTDMARNEQASNQARSDAQAAPHFWAWPLMVGHEWCAPATRRCGMILERRVHDRQSGTQLASKGTTAVNPTLAYDATGAAWRPVRVSQCLAAHGESPSGRFGDAGRSSASDGGIERTLTAGMRHALTCLIVPRTPETIMPLFLSIINSHWMFSHMFIHVHGE